VRKLVLDFDLTVLGPLILFALIVLSSSLRAYFSAKAYCKSAKRRLSEPFTEPFSTEEDRKALLEQHGIRQQEKWNAKGLIWFSIGALVILCAAMLAVDSWKMLIAHMVWYLLSYVSGVAFIIAAVAAWHYAKKPDWIMLGICFLGMLMAAASAEHFFHQRINAWHVVCPECGSDDRSDDN
jgi:hypothetical protein